MMEGPRDEICQGGCALVFLISAFQNMVFRHAASAPLGKLFGNANFVASLQTHGIENSLGRVQPFVFQ